MALRPLDCHQVNRVGWGADKFLLIFPYFHWRFRFAVSPKKFPRLSTRCDQLPDLGKYHGPTEQGDEEQRTDGDLSLGGRLLKCKLQGTGKNRLKFKYRHWCLR